MPPANKASTMRISRKHQPSRIQSMLNSSAGIFVIGMILGWQINSFQTGQKGSIRGASSSLWFQGLLRNNVHIWNREHPLGSEARSCFWHTVTFGNLTTPMCLYDDDAESEKIKNGENGGCEKLPSLLQNTNGIFVDVGSNLGTCVLYMLGHTNAKIIAIEPHPTHLHHLTSTLLSIKDKSTRDRVVVLPIAAGKQDNGAFIFTGENNYQNIDAKYSSEAMEVPIHLLSGVIDSKVDLLKVDTRGQECDILQGAKGMTINKLCIGMGKQMLSKFNCPWQGLVEFC